MLKPGDYLPGENIRIEGVIGEGAFGVVYRAWDETLTRAVAVKELRRDAPGMGSTTFGRYVDRFRREARVQAQFNHPHIVHVYRLVEQGNALYLVMEFVDGPNLRNMLEQRGPLPLEQAVQLTLELLDALDNVHKHRMDIVHRDIKPSNVLLAEGHAKLMDFGLAQLGGETSLEHDHHPGTPLYMSPEQERTVAYLKPASDLYSVGCVLFELLTGRPYKQVDDDPDALLRLRPDALPVLGQIITRATAENPAERYRRTAEFAAALRAWQRALQAAREAEQARQQREAARKAAIARRERRQQLLEQLKGWVVWGGGALLLLLLLGWGGSALLRALASTPQPAPTWMPTATMTHTATPAATSTPTPAATPTFSPTPAAIAIPPRDAQLGDTWTRPADGMVMVYVPAGEFQMGSTDAQIEAAMALCVAAGSSQENCEIWMNGELPAHMVVLDGFWIDRTEVTNAQYAQCVAAGACRVSSYADDSRYNGATQPVVGVSWEEAAAYAAWVGGRLPTEAEWEYAARGPESLVYPWGNEWETGLANCREEDCQDGYAMTAPVGSFPEGASWVGAVDLAGNVWEWVADWYGAYPSSRQVNPTGPASGASRVLRGGSFFFNLGIARCAYRDGGSPLHGNVDGGFRVVVSPARP